MGYVFAQNHRAYQQWSSRRRSVVKRPSLTPEQLEQAIARIATQFPDQVIVEVRAA